MKLEIGGWMLSLYETEYKEVSIEADSVRVVNGRKEKN